MTFSSPTISSNQSTIECLLCVSDTHLRTAPASDRPASQLVQVQNYAHTRAAITVNVKMM